MIIGIFLRHIKTYKGINFIPISDSSSFCGLVGENGIGKSTILESLDTFFHHKEWNINIEHVAKTNANMPYIMPIFLIEKNKIKLSPEEITYIEKIDKALRSNEPSELPPVSREIGLKAFEHIQKTINNLDNPDNYFLVTLGLNKDYTKTFGLFKNTIMANFKLDDLKDEKKTKEESVSNDGLLDPFAENIQTSDIEEEDDIYDEPDDLDIDQDVETEKSTSLDLRILNGSTFNKAFDKITNLYNYIYIPKELTAEEFTKLHNREFEVLMGKTLNQTLEGFIGKSLVDSINSKLDNLISTINQDLNFYTYKTPQTRQQKLRKTDIYKLITDAYFGIRQIIRILRVNPYQLPS